MYNYSHVLPSLIILLIFFLFYFRQARLPIRLNRAFFFLLLADLLTLLADYAASRMIENAAAWPIYALQLANLAFFVFFLCRTFLFYLFTEDVVKPVWRSFNFVTLLPRAVFLACMLVTLSSPLTGAVFTIDAAGGYHRGPLYDIAINYSFYYFILWALFRALWANEGLSGFDVVNLVCYNLFLAVGVTLRILMPQFLIMNTFCLFAIVVIYLSFQNPDLFLSDRGGAFNMRAFTRLVGETDRARPFSILGFVLQDYNGRRGIYGGEQMDQGITAISRYLTDSFPDAIAFYLRNGCFALVKMGECDWQETRARISERFEHPWQSDNSDLYLSLAFVETGSAVRHTSARQLIDTLVVTLEDAGAPGAAAAGWQEKNAILAVDEQLAAKRTLESAIEHDAVEVFLQPLIDSASGKVVAAEALSRLRDEQGQLISPAVFIPIAEKSGHIQLLGEQVFDKVCRFVRDHDMQRFGLYWINVNLSPIQCLRGDLAERFTEILQKYDIPASFIHLEITEQSMVDFALLQKQVETLRSSGFQFALDDYGSGFSNLSRVKKIPFTNIKIDLEVVHDYFRERDTLLPAMIDAFKRMHYSITAEGIETREMADAMCELGCEYLQGFYFSRPIPMEEFAEKYMKQ